MTFDFPIHRRTIHARIWQTSLLLTSGWLVGLVPNVTSAQDTATPIEHSIPSPLAIQSLLLDGVTIGKRAIVVGERGHILISDSPDTQWVQQQTPTQATLTGIYFANPQLGWAVGHDAIILRTQDGGHNWQRVYYDPDDERPLLDVWFKDKQYGFAIGAYGLFLETQDGGDQWSPRQIIEEDFHFNHISHAANGKLYIAAEAGNIYRSDDQGQTWLALPSPYHGSFFGSLPFADDSLLLFGLRGQLYRSENNGDHWQKIATNTEASLTEARILMDNRIIIVGLAGTVLLSHDQGQRFTQYPQADRQGLSQVLQTSDARIILIGEAGVKSLTLNSDTDNTPLSLEKNQ